MSLKACEKIETNIYQLDVAVDGERFNKAIEGVYKKKIKDITVPGFRKGKAPRHFVEKYFGEGIFYEDAVNDLFPVVFEEAVKESKIEPVSAPATEMVSIGKEGFEFKAKVTVKPEVEVGSYTDLEASKTEIAVTEEEIDQEVKRLAERNARVITAEGRPVKDGDIALIDFEGFIDGTPFEGGKGENHSLTIGSGQFIPGFEEQVVGHSAGDEFDVNVSFPEEYHVAELAGKPAMFKVKLHEIKERELPEIDDEFAKDVSEFDTLAQLRDSIREKLLSSKEHMAEDDFENQLIDQLIAGMKAEIPEVMFENSVDDMVRDFEYRLSSQGMNLDTYLAYTGMEKDSFRKSFREQAERQVKVRLALEKIASLESVAPSEEEIEAEYDNLASQYNIEKDKVKTFISSEDLAKDLAVRKTVDFIKDHAKIVENKK